MVDLIGFWAVQLELDNIVGIMDLKEALDVRIIDSKIGFKLSVTKIGFIIVVGHAKKKEEEKPETYIVAINQSKAGFFDKCQK